MIEIFTDKDKVLVRYLLNELGETEIVELEDEMLLNDELFERVQVVEMNLIDGYVRNEMTPEESLRFKETFLAVPENRDKLNQARMFHESLRLLHEVEQVEPLAVQEEGWRPWLTSLFQRPLPALAFTTLILLLIAGLIAVLYLRNHQQTANTAVANPTPSSPDNVNQAPSNNSMVVNAPAPQQRPPVVPSANKGPNSRGIEIAKNDPDKYKQIVYLFSQDEGKGERSAGDIIPITLGKGKTNLDLKYELLNDVRERRTFGVTIKNKYNRPIKVQEIEPVIENKGGKRKRFIVINVRTSVFKDSGPYFFEIDEPNLVPKSFMVKK